MTIRGPSRARELRDCPEDRQRIIFLSRRLQLLLRVAKRLANDRRCQTKEYREKMAFNARMEKT